MALITPFDPWQNNLCTCPKKYSLSPYTGCAHGCLYCYAASYIRQFNQPRAKKDFLTRLEKEVIKLPEGSTIAMANSSDCYQPIEAELKLTRQSLKIIAEHNLKINLVTKSDLITRDLDILKTLPAWACITITTIDEKLSQKLEPYAPPPTKRLKAVEKLSPHIFTAVRIDPLIYELNIDNIEKLIHAAKNSGAKQIITSTYKIKPDNFKKMCAQFPEHKNTWQELYLKQGEKKTAIFI